MQTVIFINAHSRKSKGLINRISVDFEAMHDSYEIRKIIVVKRKKQMKSKLAELNEEAKAAECVIVGGGDGTITSVLNVLKDYKVVYGLLPLGTGNVFVRSLGLPTNYAEAIELLSDAQPTPVALGSLNGTLFANISAIGISERVAATVSDRTKKNFGEVAYILSGLKELLHHSSFECKLNADGKIHRFTTHHLLIANGHYQGPYSVGGQASVFKNQLVAVAFGIGQSKFQYLKSILQFALNTHEESPSVRIIPFKKAELVTHPQRKIEVDGESHNRTPAVFTCVPDAMLVLLPV
jgi:diacylglycerol kinase (ATP)